MILDKFLQIEEEIEKLAWSNDCVLPKLIFVTKSHEFEEFATIYNYGLEHNKIIMYGESRLQEAQKKWAEKKATLHMIGPMQSNKLKEACNLFDYIHSIDSVKLLQKLAIIKEEKGSIPKILLQVNISREEQKRGILPEELEKLLKVAQDLNITIEGLMAIPAKGGDSRKMFLELQDLQKKYHLKELSIGMSQDYKIAIECGATMLRIGSIFFE